MKCLDSQLWHACAGGMVQMPPVNSDVFYFPQGHAEHADDNVDFGDFPRIPPFILCRVIGINYLAETHTDEVYAKIRLIPLPVRNTANDFNLDDDDEDGGIENQEKPTSFAKTLTQSDANNGGGFSVPRYCAETIFPGLDYSADPPVQTILAKDVHGEIWKFRHIYRGTPRRHLLTTGWSNFVNQKKLVAGDSIVFLRAENGDLRVGIRRAKRSSAGSVTESSLSPYGWNPPLGGGYCSSPFLREAETKKFMMRSSSGNGNGNDKGRVTAECVVEAATLAANGQPFEVVYRPQLSAPEFCVKASAVRAAMTTPWCSGMRFKMAFETEDSSRISWFMGTISSVQVDDPIRWSNSPWRLLQVAWDEPDLLQNVKRVSPWLVELVSNMPAIHLSPFSPTRKKTRIAQAPDFPFIGQFPVPSFLCDPLKPTSPFPLCYVSDNIPAAGIQGARHAHLGPSSADHLKKLKLQSNLFPVGGFEQLGHAAQPRRFPVADNREENNESVSCLLAMGLSSTPKLNKDDKPKTPPPMFMLFGQPIHTGQQISENSWFDLNPEKTSNFSDTSGSGSAVVQNGPPENSSDDGSPNWYKDQPKPKSEFGLEATRTGHCKVFMESEDVGRTLDLSAMGSHVWLGSISDGEQHSLSGCC